MMNQQKQNEIVDFIQVDSSHLKEVRYSKEKQELEIKFRNGDNYTYYQVPEEAYKELLQSNSKGKHFHTSIKGRYSFTYNGNTLK